MKDEYQSRMNVLTSARHSSQSSARLIRLNSFRPVSLISIKISYMIVCLGLPSAQFHSGLKTRFTYVFSFQPYMSIQTYIIYICVCVCVSGLFLNYSGPPWFDYPISTWREVRLRNLLDSSDFIPLKIHIFSSTPSSPVLSTLVLPAIWETEFYILKRKNNRQVLNFYFGTEKGKTKDSGTNNWRHSLSLICSALGIMCNNNNNTNNNNNNNNK